MSPDVLGLNGKCMDKLTLNSVLNVDQFEAIPNDAMKFIAYIYCS